MYKLIKQIKKENPELNSFLTKRKLRSKFLRNYQNCPSRYQNFLSINNAFEWINTPEGIDFWDLLNDEYINCH